MKNSLSWMTELDTVPPPRQMPPMLLVSNSSATYTKQVLRKCLRILLIPFRNVKQNFWYVFLYFQVKRLGEYSRTSRMHKLEDTNTTGISRWQGISLWVYFFDFYYNVIFYVIGREIQTASRTSIIILILF